MKKLKKGDLFTPNGNKRNEDHPWAGDVFTVLSSEGPMIVAKRICSEFGSLALASEKNFHFSEESWHLVPLSEKHVNALLDKPEPKPKHKEPEIKYILIGDEVDPEDPFDSFWESDFSGYLPENVLDRLVHNVDIQGVSYNVMTVRDGLQGLWLAAGYWNDGPLKKENDK